MSDPMHQPELSAITDLESLSAVDFAHVCAALALEKKAEGVRILHVGKMTSYTDFIVVGSAPSERQTSAIASNVDDEVRRLGRTPMGSEGFDQGHWVLIDHSDVVVHVFFEGAREYYDLEGYWQDAPEIEVDEARGLAILKHLGYAPHLR